MSGSETEEERFRTYVPPILNWIVLSILAVLGVVNQITDTIDRLGMSVVVPVMVAVSVCCSIYILKARVRSGIVPNPLIPKYYPRTRRIAWILVVVTPLVGVIVLCVEHVFKLKGPNTAVGVETQDTPTEPGGYPSVDDIQHLPTLQEVKRVPAVNAENVIFKYKNACGVDLKLILYDCYYHYFPIDDPLAPKNAWRIWDFPATNRFVTVSDFQRGTGWYVFFVERYDTGKRYQLGTRNIFYSEWPTLTVSSTSNEDEPFAATFSTEE